MSHVHTDFRNVDAHEPAAAAEFLALASRQPAIVAQKQASLAALQLGPGKRALDVGCGLGDEVQAMARAVTPGGAAIGIDISEALIARARERAEDGLAVSFTVADIYELPYEDDALDAVRVDRVLHLLDRPEAALREVARVLRPEGRLAVIEPDWDSLRVHGIDPDLARRAFHESPGTQSGIGRQLPRLLAGAGFVAVTSEQLDGAVTDLEAARILFGLEGRADRALVEGRISAEERASLARQIEDAEKEGAFSVQLRGALVSGRRARVHRPSPNSSRERVLELARAFLDGHARSPIQRDMMRRALTEVEQIGGDRIPCLHLPLAIYEAESGTPTGGEAIALVTVLAEAGIYAIDHLADRELGPHWEGVAADQVQLASIGFIGALPYLAIDDLPLDASRKVALHADLARAYLDIWAGQLGDLASEGASPEAMIEVVRGKTGARRALYARLAARFAGADEARCELWAGLGEALGMARQLSSDVLDLAGEPRQSRDLASGVITWPLAWTGSQLSGAARDAFDALLRQARDDPDARERVVERVTATGALIRGKLELTHHVHAARRALRIAEPAPAVAAEVDAMIAEAESRFTLAVAAPALSPGSAPRRAPPI